MPQTTREFIPTTKSKPQTGLFTRLGFGSNVVESIRSGLLVGVVDKLTEELDLPQPKILSIINLPSTTLTRRRKSKRLTAQESDRVYRVAAVFQAAVQLFEDDIPAARCWLQEPAKALGGSTPFEYLDTEAGATEVQDLIGRIEHGVIT